MPEDLHEERLLPCPEERQEILRRAGLILADAKELMRRLDSDAGPISWSAKRWSLDGAADRRSPAKVRVSRRYTQSAFLPSDG